MAKALQTRQAHYRQKRSDVQTRRRRIEADVSRQLFFREHLVQLGRCFMQHAAPFEFIEEVHVIERQ